MAGPLANTRHEIVAQQLAKGASPSEAYRTAGYTGRTEGGNAAATRMAQRPDIQARVAEIMRRGAARVEIDAARTLAELGRIAFADVRKLMDEDGNLRPITDLDDDTAAAIASVEVVVRPDGLSTTHKLRFWDKSTALNTIAKHLGMLVDRQQLDVSDRLAALLREARPLPIGIHAPKPGDPA